MSFGTIPLSPDDKPDGFVLLSMYEKLESENAKLRELVRAAWRCIHTGASCSDCRLIAGGCTLQSAMRELGVEMTNG